MEDGEGHDHSTFERGRIGNSVDPLGGGKVEDVDLKWVG